MDNSTTVDVVTKLAIKNNDIKFYISRARANFGEISWFQTTNIIAFRILYIYIYIIKYPLTE